MDPRTTFLLSGVALGAGVAAPAGALGTLAAVPVPWPYLLGGFVLGGAVGGGAAPNAVVDRPDLNPPDGDARWVVALALPVVLVVAGAVYWFAVAPVPGVAVPLVVGAGLSLVGAVGMAATAEAVHADRVTEAGEVLVDLGPRRSARRRRLLRGVGALGALASLAVFAWTWVDGGEPTWVLAIVAGPAVLQALHQPAERVALLSNGVRSGNQIRPWEDYEAFEVTDDHLVLRADDWTAYIRFDRDRLGDEERVVAVLEEHLERAG